MNWNNKWPDRYNNPPVTNWPTHIPEEIKSPEPAKLDDPISDEMKKRLTEERLPITPDGILMLWERVKKKLTEIKDDEMSIRKTAVKVYIPKPVEGMNTVELGEGYKLKAAIKYNYVLADNTLVEEALDKIALIGNEGPFIAARLVTWTPNFLLTEYRIIQERVEDGDATAKQIYDLINSVLTIKEAAPTLTIIEPKVKK